MMLGQRRPFDPNDPQYMGQVDTGASPSMPTMTNPIPAPPTFAPPKEGHNWIGILADALSGLSGNGPIYAPMAERRRQEQTAFERGDEQYRTRRQDALTDDARNFQQQLQLLDYKRLHPDDPLTQSLDAAGITDPTQRQNYFRQDVERRVAPPMMSAPGVDEQGNPVMRFFPRAQAAQSGPPAAAVAYLKAHPDQASAFEQKYGAGSASQVLGGQTPPASGGFPGAYYPAK